jgi:oligoribonuclease NrnB/cAMP/cGMP phosphodiesterase (DHH superfamily)
VINTELQTYLKKIDYKIYLDNSFEEVLGNYIRRGLEVLNICFGGDVRSYVAAMMLTEKGVLSVCLSKGVKGVLSSSMWQIDQGEDFVGIIRSCRNIAVILDNKDNATVYTPFTTKVLRLPNAKMYASDLEVYQHFT